MTSDTQIIANPSKRSSLAGDGDLISNLHASILSNILSRLPTKNAVQTSILSRDWRYRWTYSHNVDIAATWFMQSYNVITFANFVDRILEYTPLIRNFRLDCYRDNLTRVKKWIDIATKRDLESFDLRYQAEGIVFVSPCNLLNRASFRKLRLSLSCTLNVDVQNFAPNLTSLSLFKVQILNGNPNTSTLIFNLPLLETFQVRRCKWLNVKSVEIYAPSLTTFWSETVFDDHVSDYSIVIIGARLATFKCSGGSPQKVILDGSSASSAFLHCEPRINDLEFLRNTGLQVRELLNGLPSLKELELSGRLVKALQSQLGCPLRHNDNLRNLTLFWPGNAEQLFELLHAAPSLNYVSINVFGWVDYNYSAMESIPSCITSHLEEVVFSGFCGEGPQYNLASFLLKNGKNVKKVSLINGPGNEMKNKVIMEHLSALPKGPTCSILVGD